MAWVIDQTEEVFTQCDDDAERERFLLNLLRAGSVGGPAVVIVTSPFSVSTFLILPRCGDCASAALARNEQTSSTANDALRMETSDGRR